MRNTKKKNFETKNEIITEATNLNKLYAAAIQKIKNEIEEFELKGS